MKKFTEEIHKSWIYIIPGEGFVEFSALISDVIPWDIPADISSGISVEISEEISGWVSEEISEGTTGKKNLWQKEFSVFHSIL